MICNSGISTFCCFSLSSSSDFFSLVFDFFEVLDFSFELSLELFLDLRDDFFGVVEVAAGAVDAGVGATAAFFLVAFAAAATSTPGRDVAFFNFRSSFISTKTSLDSFLLSLSLLEDFFSGVEVGVFLIALRMLEAILLVFGIFFGVVVEGVDFSLIADSDFVEDFVFLVLEVFGVPSVFFFDFFTFFTSSMLYTIMETGY